MKPEILKQSSEPAAGIVWNMFFCLGGEAKVKE
jgi:hypothetical protein